MSSRLNTASFYSLISLLVWLPIPLGSNRIWAWALAGIWVCVCLGMSIMSFRSHWQAFPWQRLKQLQWLVIPLIAFQIWGMVQLIPLSESLLAILSPLASEAYQVCDGAGSLSLDRFATYTSVVKGSVYVMFVLAAIILIDSKQRIRTVLVVMLLSGCIQAVYGALVVLLGFEFSPVFGIRLPDVATGSFIYKNHLANYLMMCLCLGAGLLVSQLHVTPSGSWAVRIQRWVSGLISNKMLVRCALIIMVIALVMTRSRMGNSAFFSATLIGGFVALAVYRHKPRALVTLVVSLLLVDTIVVGSLFGIAKVKDRLEQTSLTHETRDEVVQWSLDIIERVPLTGTGLGSFYSIFPAFSQANVGYYDHAHNEYAQFAIEAGLPATLLLGMLCLTALYKTIMTMRRRHSKTMKGTALGCFMAIVGMLIHISVDFNLQPSANAMTFLLVLVLSGVTSVLPSKQRSGAELAKRTSRQPSNQVKPSEVTCV